MSDDVADKIGTFPAAIAPFPPRYRWLKRGTIALALYFALLGVIRWQWGVYADKQLQSRIDEYQRRGEPLLLEDFQRPPVPDERNGVLLLRKAVGLINEPPDQEFMLSNTSLSPQALTEHLDSLLKQVVDNQAVVATVRAARGMDESDWGYTVGRPLIGALLPDLSPMRRLARHLLGTARVQHIAGNDAEAIELIHDALDVSDRLNSMSGYLIVALTSWVIEGVATSFIEEAAPNLRVRGGDQETSDDRAAPRARVEALIVRLLDEGVTRLARPAK